MSGKTKIISFSNQKGGVGKTTSAVNTAAAIASLGKKVLIVDCDPQGNTTSGLGVLKKSVVTSTYDLIIRETPAKDAVLPTPQKNLFIIPSTIDLAGAEVELVNSGGREFRLKKALDELRDEYDYIIIDSPPSLGLVSINVLVASDGVVTPVQCEYYSLEGLTQLMNSVELVRRNYNENTRFLGILINMFDGRLNLTYFVVGELKKHFSDKLFKTPIPRNVKLCEAPSYGLPINMYDKFSKGALAYEAFANELIRKSDMIK